MSRRDKILEKFLSKSKTFTYDDLKKMLNGFSYIEITGGKTSGSRIAFVNYETKHIIRLHKPHPSKILKRYQMDYIESELKNMELI